MDNEFRKSGIPLQSSGITIPSPQNNKASGTIHKMLITVDANILISAMLLDDQHHSNAIRLLSLAERGIVELQTTTRLDKDISHDPWKSKLKSFPALSTQRVGAPGRVGSTTIGNGDAIVSDQECHILDELMSLIFPSAKKSDNKYANKLNDVDHLFAHSKTSASMFVTSDIPILRNADKLAAKFGIHVSSLSDFLKRYGLDTETAR